MEYDHFTRRLFHLCAPLFLVYYMMPVDFLGIGREVFLLLVFAVVMSIEGIRLATGKIFFGLREYERRQLSAYAWAAIGLTLALLFFPMIFVIPAVTGIGWTDPLIGEMRKRNMRGYPYIPLIVYFLITFGSLQLFSDLSLLLQIFLSIVASVVAITVEKPTLRYVDDDFLMLFVPLFTVTMINISINYLA